MLMPRVNLNTYTSLTYTIRREAGGLPAGWGSKRKRSENPGSQIGILRWDVK